MLCRGFVFASPASPTDRAMKKKKERPFIGKHTAAAILKIFTPVTNRLSESAKVGRVAGWRVWLSTHVERKGATDKSQIYFDLCNSCCPFFFVFAKHKIKSRLLFFALFPLQPHWMKVAVVLIRFVSRSASTNRFFFWWLGRKKNTRKKKAAENNLQRTKQ